MKMRLGFSLSVLLLATPMSAQTRPADLSSPKGTVRSLYEAAERGDEQGIRQTLLARSDAERELVDAYAKLIVSGKNLAEAAKKRFGGDADALAQGIALPEEIERLESATVKESDDTATVQTSRLGNAMTLRRTDQGWKIVLDDLAATPESLPEQISLTRDFAKTFDKVAEEITAGQYATVQDAETAIQQKMNEVMTRAARANPPTTRPATSPAQP